MPGGIVRIVPLKDFRAAALSTSDDGTAYDYGPPTSTEQVIGYLHLTSGLASTDRVLEMVIQSATSSGFTSPTTQFTFTRSTAPGADYPTPLTGLSTDIGFWRASWTLSTGTTTDGTWRGMVNLGIASVAG